jgi:hypothetical protein
MQKKSTQLIVTGTLILILIFATLSSISQVKKTDIAKNTVPAISLSPQEAVLPAASQTAGAVSDIEAVRKLEKESEGLELKRDPFAPMPKKARSSSSGPSLNGILWDETSPMAIIDAEVVKVGDNVGENTVVEIKPDSVLLSDGTTLSLGDASP